jgi:hypothetical protein
MNGTGRARMSTAGFAPNAALAPTVISDSPALTLDLLVRRDGVLWRGRAHSAAHISAEQMSRLS